MQKQCSNHNTPNALSYPRMHSYRTARPTHQRGRAARRQGQALLMAVLLMVFAALLGSTFVTVVALNLNQTTRQQDVTSARTATNAGLIFTNDQLTHSVFGERWRPEMVSPPPGPNDASYNVYWTPFEQAQGWARTNSSQAKSTDTVLPTNTTGMGGDWDQDGAFDPVKDDWAKLAYYKNTSQNRVFVKFPDPRQPNNTATPTYLVEVKFVASGMVAAGEESIDKLNKLRITVIGESQDNQNVFVQKVSYKGTNSSGGGPLSYMQYASNWDTLNHRLVATQLIQNTGTPTYSTLKVKSTAGMFPGQSLQLTNATGNTVETVIIKSVNSPTDITLNNTYNVAFATGEAVQAASPLLQSLFGKNDVGTRTFDADGDKQAIASSYETMKDTLTGMDYGEPFKADTAGTGMFFNGGLVAQEKTQINLASAPNPNVTNILPAVLTVAGRIDAPGNTFARVRDTTLATATPMPMVQAAPTPLVNFNYLPQSNNLSQNSIKPLVPPDFNSNLPRYLQLTKYSDSPNSLYGYGSGGLYINNLDEVEKVATGTNTYRELTISELQRLWQRKSFSARAGEAGNVSATDIAGGYNAAGLGYTGQQRHRLAWKRLTAYSNLATDNYTFPVATGSAGSLEQHAVRGWVSPYEFLPRGTLILLNQDVITVIRDDRSDASQTAPDTNKVWRDSSGTPLPNTYTMILNAAAGTRQVGATTYTSQPFNGVIYAEGNVRIRGAVGSKDLTIVSGGNIYVEGAIRRVGGGRIALVARKNVTLNPTQFLTHLPGQNDPAPVTDNTTKETFTNVTQPGSAGQIMRDFRADDAAVPTGDYYLTMQHSGEMKRAFDLTYATPVPPATGPTAVSASIHDPSPNNPNTVIDANEKHFVGVSSTGTDFDIDLTDVAASGPSATPTPTANLGSDGAANSLTALSQKPAFNSTPATWQLSSLADGHIPARRIASLKAATATTTWPTTHVPLTVSVGVVSNPGFLSVPQPVYGAPPALTIGSSFSWNGVNPPLSYNATTQGYWEDVGVLLPAPTPAAGQTAQSYAADTTVGESFYQTPDPANTANRIQAPLQWMSRQLGISWANTDNAIAFMRDPAENDFYNNGANSVAANSFPGYRLGFFKIERALAGQQPFRPGDYATLTATYPEQTLSYPVQATIFAEEGSWFVIPMPMNPIPDFDNNDTPTPNYSAVELAAATRYRRFNYQVSVLGNIAQNHAPTADSDYDIERSPDDDGNGAIHEWVDSLAYPSKVIDVNGGTAPLAPTGMDWRMINYIADPIPPNSNLYLPVSPALAYTS